MRARPGFQPLDGVAVAGDANDGGDLDRRATRLATERGSLFDKAGVAFGLSTVDQRRLKEIERELDECFIARRRQRAAVDARRFDRDGPVPRRVIRPPAG